MKSYRKIFAAFAFGVFLSAIVSAQAGGTFEITQSVISNGGGDSGGGNFGLTGTSGQSLAGTNSTGGGFGVRGGFWQGFFIPTAAMVAVSGRVTQTGDKGVFKARVTLTDITGTTRTAVTDLFGNFRFDDVEAGQTYIFSVSHKQFQFINNTQILTILENTEDVNFTGETQW